MQSYYDRLSVLENNGLGSIWCKEEAMDMLSKVYREQNPEDFNSFKKRVVEYFRSSCGCSEDYEFLCNYPSVLTADEEEYIIKNSSLGRWF